MSLDTLLHEGPISRLVREEGNVVGQPGGGPLAGRIEIEFSRRGYLIGSAVLTAGGATDDPVDFGAPAIGFAWLVERIVVRNNTGVTNFWLKEVADSNQIEGVVSAFPFAIADETSPLYIPSGFNLLATVTGGAAAALVNFRIQYRLVQE